MDRSKILQVAKRRILKGEAGKEISGKEESSSAADMSVGMGTSHPKETPLSISPEGERSERQRKRRLLKATSSELKKKPRRGSMVGKGLRDEPTDESEGPSVEIVVPKPSEGEERKEEDKGISKEGFAEEIGGPSGAGAGIWTVPEFQTGEDWLGTSLSKVTSIEALNIIALGSGMDELEKSSEEEAVMKYKKFFEMVILLL